MKRSIPVLILAVSLFLAGCAPAQNNSAPTPIPTDTRTAPASTETVSLSRTDSQGAVTVEVTPLNLDQPSDTLKFDVAMNTHMVDLSMDLAILTTLTTNTGLTLRPTVWDAPKGGHHIEGTLAFPATQGGKSILDGAKQLTLTMTGVDNVTRTFTWNLNVK